MIADNWSFGLFFALLGLLILAFSSWRWKQLYANTYIDDKSVSIRRRYRNIAIWGFIFFMSGSGCMIESNYFFILVGIIISYSRAFFEPYYNSSIVNDLTELCLYLRPFNVDNQNALENRNGFVKGYMGIPESIEKYLCQKMNEKIAQTFAIGNPNSNLPSTYSTTNIYANDEEWKWAVATLANKSHVIVVRIGETEGCLWEITHCAENSLLNKTILLIDNMEKLKLIKEELDRYCLIDEKVIKDINTNFALFMDEQSAHWKAIPLISKNDIKKLMNLYIDSHKSLFAKLKHQKEDNGVFKNTVKSDSIPAKFWQIISLITNPVAYCLFNKWPIRWWLTLLIYSIAAFTSAFVISFGISEDIYDEETQEGVFAIVFIFVCCIMMIPWLWLGPKVSWRCRNWGSRLLFASSNKSLALWLLACSICVTAISMLQIFAE